LFRREYRRGEISNMRNKRWVSGEMMTFGIPEETVTKFLEERGFTQVHDAGAKYLHDSYFTGENAKRTVTDGYAIASAAVRPRS
jgi:O-methyltransferase involved in polyketide biosynthesis